MGKREAVFQDRMQIHHDELRWLYMELYGNDAMFAELCSQMYEYYKARKIKLHNRDAKRSMTPEWFRQKDMLGMMLYADNFAGTLNGVREKLSYIKACNVNCLHIMPFLESPKGRSDGGYAVSDFRKIKEELGTMEDLSDLTEECHRQNINVCMDFVMNHTSEEHDWAKKARSGDGEYMSRYFFFENNEIPREYEKTVPQVFPTTAPGNFTYLPEQNAQVLTTFYPYQWDLNYKNPRVFNEMMYNFLYLANRGIDIIRIDAVPYMWKELGTSCRNLPQVHTIVRMMRMIGEIVAPSVILLGEVVMEPEKVVPYFGSIEKPECHMLYNVTTMATTWNSVATENITLLKRQLDIVNTLPKEYTFLNYLRCHDDIGWGLDFDALEAWDMKENSHKQFLNDYFTGKYSGSESRGEVYNDDPITQDARFCGTTASMCGIESAGYEQNDEKLAHAIQKDIMLHAYMLTQSGIPMLYSGDEIGQVNDYGYKDDPVKSEDSRYLHRGIFCWENADLRSSLNTTSGNIFSQLNRLEQIRAQENIFSGQADIYTYDVKNPTILCILRSLKKDRFLALFNFSSFVQTAVIQEDGVYRDLLTGSLLQVKNLQLPSHSFLWLKKVKH